MRVALISLLLFLNFCCLAQSTIPQLHTYADKFYYIRTLDSLRNEKREDWYIYINRLHSLAALAQEKNDLELSYALKLRAYQVVFDQHQNPQRDSVKSKIETVVEEADAAGLKYIKADALQVLAQYYWSFQNNRQTQAIEKFLEAYREYKSFRGEDFPMKQNYTYTLGGMYYGYEDYENVIKYMTEALSVKGRRGDKIYLTVYNTIGLCYRKTKNYDSALYYFHMVLDSAKKNGNKDWVEIAGGNIGSIYFYQGKYDEAKRLLLIDMANNLLHKQIRGAASAMITLGNIYYYQHKYDSAEYMLTEALHICQGHGSWPYYPQAEAIFSLLHKVYATKNNIRLAYLYADSALMAKDSLYAWRNALTLSKGHERVDLAERKLEEEKLQNQITINELEKGKKRIIITFFIFGLVVLLAVIFFISRERKRSENILLNILPEKIAERLKKREHPIADYFDHASVLFIDMAEFTLFADGRDPNDIVNLLNRVFTKFDEIADKHGLEKIKTIGDCYMAVSGLPVPNPHHAEAAAQMAIEIRDEMKGYKAADGTPIHFRMGLDCGPVVAGVIGQRKFIYDLWGDTVNTASRMETTGVAGEIHCSDRFKSKLEGKYNFVSRGMTEVKGKGLMETWLIV